MKREIADKWIEALTSGEFTQGRGSLCLNGCHCALGVLCELAARDGVCSITTASVPRGEVREYAGSQCHLPPEVREWAGMNSSNGHFMDSEQGLISIMFLNDKMGQTLPEIAMLIDNKCDEL